MNWAEFDRKCDEAVGMLGILAVILFALAVGGALLWKLVHFAFSGLLW